MNEFYKDADYIKEVKRLFAVFASRMTPRVSSVEAYDELALIEEKIGLVNLLKDKNLCNGKPTSYLTMSRIGMKMRTDRKKRINLMFTLDRAAEHAVYEIMYAEKYKNHKLSAL
jgi:hypothetical protein